MTGKQPSVSPLQGAFTLLRGVVHSLGFVILWAWFAVLLGAGLSLRSPAIVLLAVGFASLMHLLVVFHEEPTLAARFGAEYSRYRREVSRWTVRWPARAARR